MTKYLVIVVLSIIVTNGAALSDVCPEMGVYTVANNRSCTKYHLCVNGQTLQQECGHGLSFDRELGHCNLEAATRCNVDLCPVDTVGIVTMVGNPDDCSKYYACTRGIATKMQCAGNLLFNQRNSGCDLPENVQCAQHIDEQIYQCPARGILRQPSPIDCSKYYLCVNGVRAEFKCVNGLVFDSRRNQCNYRDISKCYNGSKIIESETVE